MFAKVIVGFDGRDQGRDALALGCSLTAPDGELVICCVHRLDGLSSRIDPIEPRLDHASAPPDGVPPARGTANDHTAARRWRRPRACAADRGKTVWL